MIVRFNEYITEGKYPMWLRLSVGGLVIQITNLSKTIEQEQDPQIQNKLIARQNKLLSYITGLGIGVGTDDSLLLNRLKRVKT